LRGLPGGRNRRPKAGDGTRYINHAWSRKTGTSKRRKGGA